MLSEHDLTKLETAVTHYCLAHPEQFLEAMKSYSVLHTQDNSHVDRSKQLS